MIFEDPPEHREGRRLAELTKAPFLMFVERLISTGVADATRLHEALSGLAVEVMVAGDERNGGVLEAWDLEVCKAVDPFWNVEDPHGTNH